MYIFKYYILVLLLAFLPQTIYSQIIINEVMANVRGADSGAGSAGDQNEFIELFNISMAEAINVNGWIFTDLDATDRIQVFDTSLLPRPSDPDIITDSAIIPPQGFAVIIDPEYVDSTADQPYDFAPNTIILTVGNTTLGDGLSTTDPLILMTAGGDTVDTFGTPLADDDFPYDPGDGVSLERINPLAQDSPDNWGPSQEPSGSTPGGRNSIVTTSDFLDLGIASFTISNDNPQPGELVTLAAHISNFGTLSAPAVTVYFFSDLNNDSSFEFGEEFSTSIIPNSLTPGKKDSVETTVSFDEEGIFSIGAFLDLPDDEVQNNNLVLRRLVIGSPLPPVILNEVMYAPVGDEPEWLEIFNRTDGDVDITGWGISDADSMAKVFVGDNLTCKSGSYFIVTESIEDFSNSHPEVEPTTVISVDGFPSLNNNGDVINLHDCDGFILESLIYTSNTGGGRGISLERVDPNVSALIDNNLGSSTDSIGSTAGRKNSLTVFINLGIDPDQFRIVPDNPLVGEEIMLSASISNLGLLDSPNFSVRFFNDLDGDNLFNVDEEIGEAQMFEGIRQDSSVIVEMRLAIEKEGFFVLGVYAELIGDENLDNNIATRRIKVGTPKPPVIINEIQYRPADDEPEWIELYNRSNNLVSLTGWSISDQDSMPDDFSGENFILNVDSYFVLTDADSFDDFTFFHPEVNVSQVIVIDKFPSLNNDGDVINIHSEDGFIIETVAYTPEFGGRRGFSLERVNPEESPHKERNWGTCVDPKGSTPARRNSIFLDSVPKRSSLSVSPKILSLDGIENEVSISYELPTTRARINLDIYDVVGRKVATLIDQRESGGKGEVKWNGRGANGNRLPIGIYVILLEAIDAEMRLLVEEKGTVVLGGRF